MSESKKLEARLRTAHKNLKLRTAQRNALLAACKAMRDRRECACECYPEHCRPCEHCVASDAIAKAELKP